MSRCIACDVVLSEQELTQKWPGSDEYSDMCMDCLEIVLDPDSANDYYPDFDGEHYEE